MKKFFLLPLFLFCVNSFAENLNNSKDLIEKNDEKQIVNKIGEIYDLNFDSSNYIIKTSVFNNKTIRYRAYENIVYVANPVDTKYQTMNIYIPEEYFNNETINNYDAKTAPIFFPNSVGGYMPGEAIIADGSRGESVLYALSRGYVVAASGARGRTLKDENGVYTGKAPASIVDLKAAIRYIKYNKDRLPAGNVERIVSNGTSAGGALSALLGASGDAFIYEPYLLELGAAKAKDNVYAVSAYCPITNLENANYAYEWMYGNVEHYTKIKITMLDYNVERTYETGVLTEEEKQLSKELKSMFPEYVNSLNLKDENGKWLYLDTEGDGTFKDKIKDYYIVSANKAIQEGKLDINEYLTTDSFLTIENGEVIDIDLEKYIQSIGRVKQPGAFDNLDMSTGENNLFGDSKTDNKHFTDYMYEHSTVNGKMANKDIVYMMNAMNFILDGNSDVSQYWRIRHGATDRDTSLAIPAILSILLENNGKNVDFFSPWNTGHSGDYDLEELFDWIDSIM